MKLGWIPAVCSASIEQLEAPNIGYLIAYVPEIQRRDNFGCFEDLRFFDELFKVKQGLLKCKGKENRCILLNYLP